MTPRLLKNSRILQVIEERSQSVCTAAAGRHGEVKIACCGLRIRQSEYRREQLLPTPINNGTRMVVPVDKVAGLLPPATVSPSNVWFGIRDSQLNEVWRYNGNGISFP